jgi:hypothetical protein
MTNDMPNPYESPRFSHEHGGMIVDRQARERLIASINNFLDEKSSNFEFDEENHQNCYTTKDITVDRVVHWLWYFYDDCKEHKASLAKPEWDYIQRLVLVLRSDAHLKATGRRHWSLRQFSAAAGLLAFLWAACWIGWGKQLFALALPFGLLSIMLARWSDDRTVHARSPWAWALDPFDTISEMRAVYESAPEFRKRRFPRHKALQPIRSELGYFGVQLNTYASWLMFSPVVLLFQALPRADERVQVVLPRAWS